MNIYLIRNSKQLFKYNKYLRSRAVGTTIYNKNIIMYTFASIDKDKDGLKFEQDETMKKVQLNYFKNEDDLNTDLMNIKENVPKIKDDIDTNVANFDNKGSSHLEGYINFKQEFKKDYKFKKEKRRHKSKIYFACVVFFIGLYSLWIPFYRSICESQGYSIRTTHTDYKFDNRDSKIYL